MDKYKDTENKAGASLKKVFGGKKTEGQASISISGGASGSGQSYSCSYNSFRSLDSTSKQNAISYAENSVRMSEERYRRAEHNLQTAKELKCRATANVQRINNNNRNFGPGGSSEKLIEFAVSSEVIADRSVILAEQHVKRAWEELQNAKNMLLAAKRK